MAIPLVEEISKLLFRFLTLDSISLSFTSIDLEEISKLLFRFLTLDSISLSFTSIDLEGSLNFLYKNIKTITEQKKNNIKKECLLSFSEIL